VTYDGKSCVTQGHTGRVKADQLRRLIRSAGLSVRGAALALDMTERQLYRYLAGDAEVPRVVELALKWVSHTRKG
jgi:hypothetical protein